MGTPGFAVAALDALVKNSYTVVAVVTAPDRPAGRGRQVQFSEVKDYALAHSIPVLQPEKLKQPEFLEALRAFRADLQIVVAFRMLPEVVWNMPPLGTFNLHASLLPRYRGAAPINRAVMNGDTETGVTTFFLEHAIDTGNIAFRQTVPIGPEETAGELHNRLMVIGAQLVLNTVNSVADGTCPKQPQHNFVAPGELLPEAPKLFREDAHLNWADEPHRIINQIRGLSPYPAAWTELQAPNTAAVPLKIFRARFLPAMHKQTIGQCRIDQETLQVAVTGGWISLESLQAAGKKQLNASDFLRGFRLPEGAVLR